MSQNKKKMSLGGSFANMFKRLFKKDSGMSVLEEEAIRTPLQTIIRNYLHNRLGMLGLVMFLIRGPLLSAYRVSEETRKLGGTMLLPM